MWFDSTIELHRIGGGAKRATSLLSRLTRLSERQLPLLWEYLVSVIIIYVTCQHIVFNLVS